MIWLGLLTLLACSALVSGSETALFALSRVTLSQFRASPSALQRRAHRLMQRPRAVLMTVLITNTAINVAIFAVSFVALEGADVAEAHATDDPPSAGDARVGGDAPAASPSAAASAIGSIAVLIAVILFGEMVPKAVALSSAKRIAPAATLLIGALYAVLGPVQWVLHTFVVDPLTRLLSPVTHVPDVVSPEELRLLVERSAREGIISSKEHEMLQGAVALGDAGVREVMTPRVDIQAASADADVASVCADMRASHRRRLPVCGADLDDIRGMLHARDLYLAPTASISELMREAHFVPEQINLVQLIRHFREEGIEVAIVVDEYGGTTGLVSMQDVVERIVGDLAEYDAPREAPATERLDDNRYRLAGNLSVRLWADRFGVGEIDRRVDTVGGLVLARLGRLPRPGDAIQIRNLTLTVEAMEGRRIARVLLERTDVAAPAKEATA